ncbi:hypothetical protein SO802_006754 [Lithocarpus litseifolius]|uniref:RNase H type-1 domain-containing protein n=1 Tax=Lithocarpus litseifolius TaxID=425828 RepID=A0AAW2DSF1_9ROSI
MGWGRSSFRWCKISNILRDEDAFQNHLEKIDMELEGHLHPTKGIHKSFSLEVGKGDDQGIGVIMMQESTLAETNSKIMDVAIQAEVELPKIVTHMNKEEGSLFSPKGCEEQDKQWQESPSVGLGQPSSGLDNATSAGPNTRTWKRLQHQPMHVGTVVTKDVEVGIKRKHKPVTCISEPIENLEMKKRREDDEVLEMSALLKNEFGSAIQMKKPEAEVGWTMPHPPYLKINVDGAVFERQRLVGIGVVVRDHLGLVRVALSMKVHGLLGPLETEAKAMEEGLRFAWDQDVHAAIFEGDSMVVYNSLTGSITPPSSICNLITGSLLQASRFGECNFSIVPRSGNRVAHGLVQYAKNLSDSCTWIRDMPPFLEQLVSHDILFSSSF